MSHGCFASPPALCYMRGCYAGSQRNHPDSQWTLLSGAEMGKQRACCRVYHGAGACHPNEGRRRSLAFSHRDGADLVARWFRHTLRRRSYWHLHLWRLGASGCETTALLACIGAFRRSFAAVALSGGPSVLGLPRESCSFGSLQACRSWYTFERPDCVVSLAISA